MLYLWAATAAAGLVLQIWLIAVLLRGAFKEYKVLFAYAIVLFATTAIEVRAFFDPNYATASSTYYWVGDSVRQGLLYLVVISLIYGASEQTARRASIRRLLLTGATLFAGLSFYFTYKPLLGTWMTDFSRNLGFLALILNLLLWAVLLKHRQPDQTLLLVSGGMGIQMAGKAIGHSLRGMGQAMSGKLRATLLQQLSFETITAGDLLIVLSHVICLYIWIQAFRKRPANRSPSSQARVKFGDRS